MTLIKKLGLLIFFFLSISIIGSFFFTQDTKASTNKYIKKVYAKVVYNDGRTCVPGKISVWFRDYTSRESKTYTIPKGATGCNAFIGRADFIDGRLVWEGNNEHELTVHLDRPTNALKDIKHNGTVQKYKNLSAREVRIETNEIRPSVVLITFVQKQSPPAPPPSGGTGGGSVCSHNRPSISQTSASSTSNSVTWGLKVNNRDKATKTCKKKPHKYKLSVTNKPSSAWKFTLSNTNTTSVAPGKAYSFKLKVVPPSSAPNGTYRFNVKAKETTNGKKSISRTLEYKITGRNSSGGGGSSSSGSTGGSTGGTNTTSPTCVKKAPTFAVIDPPNLTRWGQPGVTKEYTVKITNNDTGPCKDQTFVLSKVRLPGSNWSGSFVDRKKIIPKGGSKQTKFKVTSNPNASEGKKTIILGLKKEGQLDSQRIKKYIYFVIKAQSPKGYHDISTCTDTGGWTCDPDNYSEALNVHFYADGPAGTGKYIGQTKASNEREVAVGNVCGGNRNHGFKFTTPESLKDGKPHTIYSYAINIGAKKSNPKLTNSPKTITCGSANPEDELIKQRDNERQTDMKTISGALQDYKKDNNIYPAFGKVESPVYGWWKAFGVKLNAKGKEYLNPIPRGPGLSGGEDCDQADYGKPYDGYLLAVSRNNFTIYTNLENKNNPSATGRKPSPSYCPGGSSCTSNNITTTVTRGSCQGTYNYWINGSSNVLGEHTESEEIEPITVGRMEISLGIDGIGSTPRVPTGGNEEPLDTIRTFEFIVFDALTNEEHDRFEQALTYNPSTKKFEASIDNILTEGLYNIFASNPRYLTAKYPTLVKVVEGGDTDLTSNDFYVIAGNVNNKDLSENKIDLLDYNVLLSCSEFSIDRTICDEDPVYIQYSDLNDDGSVDQADLTLWLKEYSNQSGAQLPN